MLDETIGAAELCPTNPSPSKAVTGPSRWHSSDDAMAELTGSGPGRGELGQDLRRGPVLEVAQAWGDTLLDVRHMDQGALTVGEDKAQLFVPAADLPEPSFALFGRDAQGFYCRFSDRWEGTLRSAGSRERLSSLASAGRAQPESLGVYRLELDEGDQVVLDIGTVTFVARIVPASMRIAKRSERPEATMLGIGAFSAFLGGLLAFVALSQPPQLDNQILEVPDRIAQLMLTPPPEEAPTPKAVQEKKVASGKKAIREEGKAGKRDADMERARGRNLDERRNNKRIAEEAGVLGQLADIGGLDGLMGSAGLNADITGGIGGLIGAKGVQNGTGLGSRGSGLGGGGQAHGIGGLGLHGRSAGDADYGQDGGRLAGKREGDLRSPGGSIAIGALDKAQVDAVMKRNMARFRYCYQRELTKDPNLGGKISLKFVIAKDGSVSSSNVSASSLGSQAVEGCMANTVRSLTFPEPRGGGVVFVSYPFLFSPG